jgi:hypothetical protein
VSATRASRSHRVSAPIGTLSKNTHRQLIPDVSAPPMSGPVATDTPAVAPQIPSAVPRSGPWNSCAISASEVANIAAPPMPCIARLTLRKSGSGARPQ